MPTNLPKRPTIPDIIHTNPKETQTKAKELLQTRSEKEERDLLVKRNKELKKLKGIKHSTHFYEIIAKYIRGTTVKELAKEYHFTETRIVEMIEEHSRDLVNARETNAIVLGNTYHNQSVERLKKTEVLNEEFLSLLSPPTSPNLSEEEALFCWLYVHKGDSEEAIEEAGLNIGLFKSQRVTYKRGILTRSIYLQNKTNIAQYIKELREAKYHSDDITKKYVQELILDEIDKIKQRGDKRDSVNLRQLIELLGKSIGAFTERIEIHEVDPNKALDHLIELAKEANVKELS